jgi:hypothetical protein
VATVSEAEVAALAARRRPVDEVTRLADQADAGLVVLSTAMSQTARQAQQAAEAITAPPHLTMLDGRPSDHLYDLLTRAARRKRPASTSTAKNQWQQDKKRETSRGPPPPQNKRCTAVRWLLGSDMAGCDITALACPALDLALPK